MATWCSPYDRIYIVAIEVIQEGYAISRVFCISVHGDILGYRREWAIQCTFGLDHIYNGHFKAFHYWYGNIRKYHKLECNFSDFTRQWQCDYHSNFSSSPLSCDTIYYMVYYRGLRQWKDVYKMALETVQRHRFIGQFKNLLARLAAQTSLSSLLYTLPILL